MRRFLPEIMLIYAATMWGLIWYPLRLLADAGISGLWQTLISYLAAILLLLWLYLKRRQPTGERLGRLLLGISAGWTNVAFVLAMLEGEVLRVLLLFYLSPVWAVVLGYLILHEKLSLRAVAMILTAMLGALLMLYTPAAASAWLDSRADWLALSSGFAFAFSNIYVRKMQTVTMLDKAIVSWLGVVLISIVMLLSLQVETPQTSPSGWAGVILLGLAIASMTLAVQYGVSQMRVQRSAVILLFELVVGGGSAAWIAGESLQLREWLGGLLIVAAGLWFVFFEKDLKAAVE